METYKIDIADLLEKISQIYFVNLSRIKYSIKCEYFDIYFNYKDIIIHIYTNQDRFNGYKMSKYQDIVIKKDSSEFIYNWTPFNWLLAYNDNVPFKMKIDQNYLLSSISILKKYIDSNNIFFEYHNNNFSERFFQIGNEINKLPLIIDVDIDKELFLKFGCKAERIIKNKPLY